MANYRAILRRFPSAFDYLRTKWVRCGDVYTYAPGIRKSCFSTDDFGFRHIWFEDQNLSLADAKNYSRIGFILGASHMFGFGLSHNRETLASQLSEFVGFPVYGIAYPEADTRTLYCALVTLLRQFVDKTKLVILTTGGDLTRYCYTGEADALFGPPAPMLPTPSEGQPTQDSQRDFKNLLRFTTFWTDRCAALTSRAGVPFYLAHETTFFEKSTSDECEKECDLGTPPSEALGKRFAIHRFRMPSFVEEKARHAAAQAIRVARFPPVDDLLFVDEYHYRAESQRHIAQYMFQQISCPS
jgi:hypothetical protein